MLCVSQRQGGESKQAIHPGEKVHVNNPSQLNNEVQKAFARRKTLCKVYKTNPTQKSDEAHERAGKRVKRIVRSAKRNKEKNYYKSAKRSSKGYYAYVHERRDVRNSIGPLRNRVGDLKSFDADKSMKLNEYFSTVFTDERMNNIPDVELPGAVQPLKNNNFFNVEIDSHLSKLNVYKSS